jgi:hypothetical protein
VEKRVVLASTIGQQNIYLMNSFEDGLYLAPSAIWIISITIAMISVFGQMGINDVLWSI